jgi:hypothetical protein
VTNFDQKTNLENGGDETEMSLINLRGGAACSAG